jgi:hypothetical protein
MKPASTRSRRLESCRFIKPSQAGGVAPQPGGARQSTKSIQNHLIKLKAGGTLTTARTGKRLASERRQNPSKSVGWFATNLFGLVLPPVWGRFDVQTP